MFNHKIKQYNIGNLSSHFCGIAVEYGSTININSKNVLKQHGIKRVSGTPTQITGKHLAEHNMVVCLTEDHKYALKNIVADKFVSKIVCFKDFCNFDITDPYGGDVGIYEKCFKKIDEATECLINTLLNNNIAKYKRSKNV